MTTKHTPGPWNKGSMFGTYNISNETLIKNKIVHINKPVCFLNDYGLSKEECEANAGLIAAAPELLAELKNVLMAWRGKRISKKEKLVIFNRAWDIIERLEGPEQP